MRDQQPDQDIKAKLEADVKHVHDFIAKWFQGNVEQSEALFEQNLSQRLAKDLINIQPSGQVLSRKELLSSIQGAYGANENFSIEISDFQILKTMSSENLWLATYCEHQKGARNTTPPDNTRITTVIFQDHKNEDHPLWLHLHETAQSSVNI